MESKRKVTLPHPSYQPKKAELQKRIKIEVPGKSVEKKMEALADALMQPVDIQYRAGK